MIALHDAGHQTAAEDEGARPGESTATRGARQLETYAPKPLRMDRAALPAKAIALSARAVAAEAAPQLT